MKDKKLGLLKFALFVLLVGCTGQETAAYSDTNQIRPAATSPPANCNELWAKTPAQEFVRDLVKVTGTGAQVWRDYDLGDMSYLLYAGDLDNGNACYGVWRKGKAIGAAALPDRPKLSTALYGYYLKVKNLKADADKALIKQTTGQPESLDKWLQGLGVNSAIIMPVDFPKFPFKISSLVKVQIAIHEAFHLEVQMRYWLTSKGDWPSWDRQPDRKALRSCYTKNDEVKDAFRKEREKLVLLVASLLDGKKKEVCTIGKGFFKQRKARYKMLKSVRVNMHDKTPGRCSQAEAIMEMEEGVADYASWTKLFELGVSSREKLFGRYRAIQKEPFYLTGAMQMHAISLLNPNQTQRIIKDIADAKTLKEGSLTAFLSRSLKKYCQY